MVFVDTTLDDMLQDVGSVPLRVMYDLMPKSKSLKWFYAYQKENRRILEISLNQGDFERLTREPDYHGWMQMSLIDFLVENSFYRGYDGEPHKPIQVKYFFGETGAVFQVIDEGKGFDAVTVIEAAQQGKLEKGKHYKDHGWAIRTLAKPEFEAAITSSEHGTTVTVMYTYQDTA